MKAESTEGSNDIASGLELVLSQIADWNFADTDGKKLSLTMDGLTKLFLSIVTWLSKQQEEILRGANADAKKKSLPAA